MRVPKHNNNLKWFDEYISCKDREKLHNHKGAVIWFTGLPASGKSTIAHLVEKELYKRGCSTYVLDGDNVRHGLCSNLGFSPKDRNENIRRIAETAKLFVDAGIIVLAAFISPYRKGREWVKGLIGKDVFIEIYCDCSLEICEQRDVKGHYQQARIGKIPKFTGISAPYEASENPDLYLNTGETPLGKSVDIIVKYLLGRKIIKK